MHVIDQVVLCRGGSKIKYGHVIYRGMHFQESRTHASALSRAGHLHAALAKFRAAAEKAKHAAPLRSRCIDILMRLRDFTEAHQEIKLFLQQWPGSAAMHVKAAHALMLMGGQPVEAAAELDAAQRLLRDREGHLQITIDAMRQQVRDLVPDGHYLTGRVEAATACTQPGDPTSMAAPPLMAGKGFIVYK